jgi:Predicted membrane protein (DUF2232)
MIGRLGSAAVAVACGLAAACLYLAVVLSSPGAMILVYMTQLPLFLAGLWLGAGAAALAGLAASLVLLAASDVLAAAIFAALNAVPVVLLVRQALLARRREDGALMWYPPGLLTAWLTGLALVGIAGAFALLGGPDGLQTALQGVVGHALDRLAGQSLPQRDEIAGTLAMVIPGVVAASWMVMALINGALAQGVLARFGANWRPSPDLAALGLPLWIPIALVLAMAAIAIGGPVRFVGINIAIALSVPLCLAGLAVMHAAARRLAHPAMALVVFYTLAGLFGWPLVAIAVLGLFENWLGLRRRLAPQGVGTDG